MLTEGLAIESIYFEQKPISLDLQMTANNTR